VFQVWNVSFELHYSPRSVVKPGVTCRGIGKMSCDCFRLRQTSWYFVYETTAGLCLDQRRQPGAISSSLCSTTEYCNTTAAAVAAAMNYLGCNTLRKLLDYQCMQTFHSAYTSPPPFYLCQMIPESSHSGMPCLSQHTAHNSEFFETMVMDHVSVPAWCCDE